MRAFAFACAFVLCAFFSAPSLDAASLVQISDLISTSAPATTTVTHTIRFATQTAIPASGRIVVTAELGAFTLPVGFDYTDVDVAVSTGGPYVDRTLAASASATDDGVATTSNSLVLTLNSTSGISAGSLILIELGTAATHGALGDTNAANPSGTGSYRIAIETQNGSNVPLDFGKAMTAIVAPVVVTFEMLASPPVRTNGLPSGTVAANHSIIEISLNTDEVATCKYATSTGVTYSAMTNTFSSNASSSIFYKSISGHQNGTTYNYYVKCVDGNGNENPDDYAITFSLAPTPQYDGSVTIPDGGAGGVGPYPLGSSKLYLSTVTISGYASPLSTITILKDGVTVMTTQTKADGTFTATPPAFERGTYTFMAYVTDRAARRSSSYSSTLAFAQGTTNTISNVVIPPTLAMESDSVSVSEPVRVFGEGVSGATIELLIGTKKFSASTTKGVAGSPDGMWEINFNSSQLAKGTHILRARTLVPGHTQSGASTVLLLGVGEDPNPALAGSADLNQDGKVNLVDFSILLSHWSTADEIGDINVDGRVNIADFSIMLFQWTG